MISQVSYFSPKLEVKASPQKGGLGVFARKLIQKGELLVQFGGSLLSGQELEQLPFCVQQLSIQVAKDLYLVSIQPEHADRVNHSCNPNAGMKDERTLVAMQTITFGEEVCFDYAMSDSNPYDDFECYCGASNCRGKFTGNDWRSPQLWKQYAGYFSPYLHHQIEQLKAGINHKTQYISTLTAERNPR